MSGAERGIALVTGGGRGIGAATAKRLAAAGYDVAVNYRRDGDAAGAVLEAIADAGGRGFAVPGDIADEDALRDVFARVDARGRLAALVNNAAILFPQTTLDGISTERMRRVFEVNVVGAMACAREAVQRMSRRFGGAGGAIVNVSSAAARWGSPNEYVDYAATKGAIDTFTRGLAVEEAPFGVRVNAVRPGIIETDMHADGGEPGRVARIGPSLPMGRGGTADEVAAAIGWLLSDEASYVTGAFIDCAGGR